MHELGTLTWARATGGAITAADEQTLATQIPTVLAIGSQPRPDVFPNLDFDRLAPPDSALTREVDQLLRDTSPAWLLGHSRRTWYFARALSVIDHIDADPELLYAATALHDLGLTDRFAPSHDVTCFAVSGAYGAMRVVTPHREQPEVEVVGEAIAMHLNLDLDPDAGPVSRLVQMGTLVDVSGLRLQLLPQAFVATVLATHPRQDFGTRVGHTLAGRAGDVPPDALRVARTDTAGQHTHPESPSRLQRLAVTIAGQQEPGEDRATARILEAYGARTPRSAAIGPRAEQVLPGGDTRAAGFHLPYPLTLARGARAKVWDLDGNEYWDLSGNYTSLVHGHAFAPVVAAAERAIRDGSAWPARNLAQIELAELLVDRVGSIEQVRFCNSGTEAGLLALAVARVVTGRPKILMARFGYHGSHELFEAGSFDGFVHPSGDAPYLADYGDASGFEAVLEEHGAEIAAVFLEPVMGAAGIVAAPSEFFQRVQIAARDAGALFIADEVISFRLGAGGKQASLGINPDLTMLGKLIGGGFPVGALGGRADLMAVMDPRQPRLFHSGTFNGNPVTMAAGLASVSELTDARIATMHALTAHLDSGLREAANANGLPFSVRRAGSLLNLFFTNHPPGANLLRPDQQVMAAFHLAALNHGLFFAPRGLLVVSTAMDGAEIDEIVQRAAEAFADIAAVRTLQ